MDCVLRVSCYKEIILHFHHHFPIIPLLNFMVKRFGSHNMTMLYPHLCYNEVCYKGITL